MSKPTLLALLFLFLAQPATPPPVTIPFELATRHILVKVSVNGSRPLSFVLDTGASPAIVRLNVAQELRLSLQGSVTGRGAGPGSQTGSLVRNAKWSLAGLDGFSQPVAVALPMPELPHALGRDVDGIIGGDFIKQFVVEFDYQASVIRLHNRATFAYSGRGETLPLEFNADGHPVVRATVTPPGGAPIEQRFMLDTGNGLALVLHSPFVNEHKLLAAQQKTVRPMGSGGAGGRSTGRLGRVAALQIGSFTIKNPIALFAQDTAGAFANRSIAGNIGAQIARRFRMFLDYGRQRVILEPSAAFAEPFDQAFSGIALRAEGADYRTFRIRDVLEDSPATDAGLVIGDVIEAIDGTPADRLTLAAINALFEKPVAYTLKIRRNDQIITLTLTPRSLI